ncbi:T9SS type A sorting domain-containing protein [Flavobacterium sp.]|uniref:T9SS type A sorting domain-containing protein n=1 Tax=Flavobacterium sp. TaxID=239 RepID=UPI003C3C5A55
MKKHTVIFGLVFLFQIVVASVVAQTTTYAPAVISCGETLNQAKISLNPGNYKMYVKVWIDSGASLLGFKTTIGSYTKELNWDFKNLNKGQWMTLNQEFSISEAVSNQIFKIQLLEDEYSGTGTGIFNLDNLYIEYLSPLSTEDFNMDKIVIYPNPTSNIVNIECPEGSQIKVYNSLGVLLKNNSPSVTHNLISVTDLPSGIYYVKINWNGKQKIKKMIVK